MKKLSKKKVCTLGAIICIVLIIGVLTFTPVPDVKVDQTISADYCVEIAGSSCIINDTPYSIEKLWGVLQPKVGETVQFTLKNDPGANKDYTWKYTAMSKQIVRILDEGTSTRSVTLRLLDSYIIKSTDSPKEYVWIVTADEPGNYTFRVKNTNLSDTDVLAIISIPLTFQ